MKTKKTWFGNLFSFTTRNVAIFVLVAALLFPATTFAVDWGVGYNSTTGGVVIGVGSNGSGAGSVWGGGLTGGGWSLNNPYGLPSGSISGIISNILFWLLSLFALAGVIGFVLSGIFYLIAAGDKDMMEKGKNGITWSIIGIVVGLSGFLIMQAVNLMLSGASKTF